MFSTDSGEETGTKVANLARGRIGPNRKNGRITFDATTMWHSAKTKNGWASVQVIFPCAVALNQIAVHSQHSGEYHGARALRIAVREGGGKFRQIAEADLKSADDSVAFSKTKGRVWQLEFQTGESRSVVLRGLQFFSDSDELFPPLVPYQP
jgi:hypothetical protein